VFAGNLLLAKLSIEEPALPLHVLSGIRRFLPLSCGILVHTEISAESSGGTIDFEGTGEEVVVCDLVSVTDDAAVRDDGELYMTRRGRPAFRVWAEGAVDAGVYIGAGTASMSGALIAADDLSEIDEAEIRRSTPRRSTGGTTSDPRSSTCRGGRRRAASRCPCGRPGAATSAFGSTSGLRRLSASNPLPEALLRASDRRFE
jgi:hypothetical protein